VSSPSYEFGLPPDGAAWAATVAAGAALLFVFSDAARARARCVGASRWAPWLVAASAAALSFGYVHYYLGGGPRIIDATSYYLEARTFAAGGFTFETPWPTASFRGRFLTVSPEGELGVIFPPGYPVALAAAVALGHSMLLGPAIAAALVLATHGLARVTFGDRITACGAALLSALSVALRYHTADTMSHGFAALLLTLGVRACLERDHRSAALGGLAFGWLVATRPLTGVAAGAAVLIGALRGTRLVAFALGAVPGTLLLFYYQHALTGDPFEPPQFAYYALADGPPGCFRYGFGESIGCLFEHGDYVRAQLPNGYGFTEALRNTLRRLSLHAQDIANAEPLALCALAAVVWSWKRRGARTLCVLVPVLMLAYAPFYFDGSYPGGGARLFAEALPIEHVLLSGFLTARGWWRFCVPLSLAGFAFHTSFAHRALALREGGRPMFEPERLAGAPPALVFVATDHGFNLGHAPSSGAVHEHLVARRYEDAHDWVLWEALGRPASFRYDFDPGTPGAVPSLRRYAPEPSSRFEAEAQWPPLGVTGAFAHPSYPPHACVSKRRALSLVPTAGESFTVTLELVALEAGSYEVFTGWTSDAPISVAIRLETAAGVQSERRLEMTTPGCAAAGPFQIELRRGASIATLRVRAFEPSGRSLGLDFLELSRIRGMSPPNRETRTEPGDDRKPVDN